MSQNVLGYERNALVRHEMRHKIGVSHNVYLSRHLFSHAPRVRGNPTIRQKHDHGDGSIPACTGEPTRIFRRTYWSRVYPRVYGGTLAEVLVKELLEGLSPRVRGNPKLEKGNLSRIRSIPACTGEPTAFTRQRVEIGWVRAYNGVWINAPLTLLPC